MYVITGASRGIGKFLFDCFLNAGKEVSGFYHTNEPEEHKNLYYKVDVNIDGDIAAFIDANIGNLKDVILLNTAGISYNAIAHKSELEQWKYVLDTNVVGLFNVCRRLLPIMRENEFGRIINFSSVVAQQGVPGTSAYAASKSALWGLSKSLVAENANKNITINNINLGYFNIGMIEQVRLDLREAIIQKIPMKRLGEAREILSAVNFIVDTPYFNGASLDLNGGLV